MSLFQPKYTFYCRRAASNDGLNIYTDCPTPACLFLYRPLRAAGTEVAAGARAGLMASFDPRVLIVVLGMDCLSPRVRNESRTPVPARGLRGGHICFLGTARPQQRPSTSSIVLKWTVIISVRTGITCVPDQGVVLFIGPTLNTQH